MYYTSKSVYELISKQANDPIIEWKKCRVSGKEFPIFKSDLDFYKKISPKFGDKVFEIPTPNLCPEERQRRRLLFRNERKLYRRKCDASGKDIISIYSLDSPYKAYDQKYRWSDKRDPIRYGRYFDFGINFTEQFIKLELEVPKVSIINDDGNIGGSINCQYTNDFTGGKNCYMCFETGDEMENCLFVHHSNKGKELIDCEEVTGASESSYFCIDSELLFGCIHVYNSSNCTECLYSTYLQNCKKCIFCIGVSNKSNYYLNQEIAKDEITTIKKRLLTEPEFYKKEVEKYKKLKSTIPLPATNQKQCSNSLGSSIIRMKSCLFCYSGLDSENVKFGLSMDRVKNCMDIQCRKSERSYEGQTLDIAYHSAFCCRTTECKYTYYCSDCYFSEYLFGCIGLRNKSYCIFNKQYTREEYENLVPKIIEHMISTGERGEFFNPSMSPFGYNETGAQEYFPLTKEEALTRGYKRQDKNYDPVIPENVKVLKGEEIPGDISSVSDEILKQILICEVSGRPFRIIKQELEFYRKHNLPIPRKHPDIRHEERFKQRPARELHLRNCDKCGIEMISVYPKLTEKKVYCEQCYNHEIYG